MQDYELVAVLSPVLNQEETSRVRERIKGFISERGGTITREEQWGMRRLAYPIKKGSHKFTDGNYQLFWFSLKPNLAREVDNHLRISDEVIRHLLVKAEAVKPAEPQPAPAQQESNG